MNPYKMFKTNQNLETSGIVLDYGDFRIRIARAGGANKKFAKILEAKMKPYRRQADNGTLQEDIANNVLIESYAEGVVLGFEVKVGENQYESGVPQEDGTVKPYSVDAVKGIFHSLPDLFADVQTQARQMALFREQEVDEDIKN